MATKKKITEERVVTKRRVTMRSYSFAGMTEEGEPAFSQFEAVDYVHPEHLDAYVDSARAAGWNVEVADEPDAGPGGWGGEYTLPAHIDHPEAGITRPAVED